ncbi:hypothetical protein KCU85_g498, partial [Aureobasidium melanogenum]
LEAFAEGVPKSFRRFMGGPLDGVPATNGHTRQRHRQYWHSLGCRLCFSSERSANFICVSGPIFKLYASHLKNISCGLSEWIRKIDLSSPKTSRSRVVFGTAKTVYAAVMLL